MQPVLKNRQFQDIPKQCPISEAIIWVANGCLPLSFEDIQETGFYPFALPVGNSPQTYSIYSPENQKVDISAEEIDIAKNQVFSFLIKGTLVASGILAKANRNELLDKDKDLSKLGPPPTPKEILNNWKDVLEIRRLSNAPVNLPGQIFSYLNTSWQLNHLSPPHEINSDFYYSRISIPTLDLFDVFIDKGHLSKSEISNLGLNPSSSHEKRGRPSGISQKDLLEEIVVMFMTGKLQKDDNRDSFSTALSHSLKNNLKVNLKANSIKRDRISDIFLKAELRNKREEWNLDEE